MTVTAEIQLAPNGLVYIERWVNGRLCSRTPPMPLVAGRKIAPTLAPTVVDHTQDWGSMYVEGGA